MRMNRTNRKNKGCDSSVTRGYRFCKQLLVRIHLIRVWLAREDSFEGSKLILQRLPVLSLTYLDLRRVLLNLTEHHEQAHECA